MSKFYVQAEYVDLVYLHTPEHRIWSWNMYVYLFTTMNVVMFIHAQYYSKLTQLGHSLQSIKFTLLANNVNLINTL